MQRSSMGVKEKTTPFPNYMKDKLDSFVKTPNLNIKYEAGKIITLTKTNVNVIVPHIITFQLKTILDLKELIQL